MPTELDELKHIHAELVEIGRGGIGLNALIEKWPMLYKRRPEGEPMFDQIPGVIAYAGGLLSESVSVAGEFEADSRPWLDANGNPIVNSAGEPFRIIPGWKSSVRLIAETHGVSAEYQRQRQKAVQSFEILCRFLPPDLGLSLGGDNIGRWLFHLAEKCASGAAGKRHQTQWKLFGRGANGGLLTVAPVLAESSAGPPFDKMLQSLGDPAPQRIEIADVIGASQVVLADWISDIETKRKKETAAVEEIGPQFDYQKLSDALGVLPPGKKHALDYEKLVAEVLTAIFSPDLANPVSHQPVDQARMSIDITFDNRARGGFFATLRDTHRKHCPYIFFECKNYSQKFANPEFAQLEDRMRRMKCQVGFLVCRVAQNDGAVLKQCQDRSGSGADDNIVLVLLDGDLVRLLDFRAKKDAQGVTDYLERKLRQVLFKS